MIDGVFLGLMDRDDLAALDAAFYARTSEPIGGVLARYEDPAHIRSRLHDWERAALDEAFPGWRARRGHRRGPRGARAR